MKTLQSKLLSKLSGGGGLNTEDWKQRKDERSKDEGSLRVIITHKLFFLFVFTGKYIFPVSFSSEIPPAIIRFFSWEITQTKCVSCDSKNIP